ncbi:MAG: DUF11 domain-containing protein [Chloroflexi bacterium]|nr:MAG: DUF11 domain-containing protein [Chloroflexota bacterium]
MSDENPGGVAAADVTDVTTAADLAVGVTDGLGSVTAGTGGHGYTITVSNGGPSDASGVTLADTWPAGFGQGAIVPSQGTCAPVGAGPDFTCDLGTVPAGGSATVSVAYAVPAATGSGPQVDAVSVSSPVSDPDASDNAATDSTTVVVAPPPPTPRPTASPTPGPTGGAMPPAGPTTTPGPSPSGEATGSPEPTVSPSDGAVAIASGGPSPGGGGRGSGTVPPSTDGSTADPLLVGGIILLGSILAAIGLLLVGFARRRRRRRRPEPTFAPLHAQGPEIVD